MNRILNKRYVPHTLFLTLFLALFLVVTSIVLAQTPPPPPIVLAAPRNLVANPISPTQINLSWTASEPWGLMEYRVYRCSGSGCTPTVQVGTVGTVASPSYSDTGLSSGTYVYGVTAYGTPPGFGESAKSTVTANTQVKTYGLADFVNLVAQWLQTGTGLSADVNTDNVVNTRDLGIMMSFWSAT